MILVRDPHANQHSSHKQVTLQDTPSLHVFLSEAISLKMSESYDSSYMESEDSGSSSSDSDSDGGSEYSETESEDGLDNYNEARKQVNLGFQVNTIRDLQILAFAVGLVHLQVPLNLSESQKLLPRKEDVAPKCQLSECQKKHLHGWGLSLARKAGALVKLDLYLQRHAQYSGLCHLCPRCSAADGCNGWQMDFDVRLFLNCNWL